MMMMMMIAMAAVCMYGLCGIVHVEAFGGNGDKVILKDVSALTLYHGRMTTGRRSSGVPQVNCLGGSAGCSDVPDVVQCTNVGFDGVDVQWKCKADMDSMYRFGTVNVLCEGYDYADDPYILRGSCGVEFTLELTKGRRNSYGNYGGGGYGRYGGYGSYGGYGGKSSWSSIIGLVFLGILLYSFCGNSGSARRDGRFGGGGSPGFGGGGSGGGGGYPGSGCGQPDSGGSFWTGAATGGMLGYLLGNRGGGGYNNYGYGYNTGFGGRRGYGGGYGGGGFGGGGFGGGGGGGGTRAATGFGGTRRR